MLLRIPGIFSAEEARHIRETLQTANWVDGKVTAGYQSAPTKHNQQLPQNSQLAHSISNLMLPRIWNNPLFYSAALPAKVFPPLYNCYSQGGHFGYHTDNAIRTIPDSTEQVRTDLSATVFFSEPDSYDGGELVIRDTYGEQRVKLAAGDMVLYPSTSLHQVLPVTRGARIASFFWIQSLIREDAQRTMLFEMDQAIQALQADHPQHPSVLQLSGTYHNLIRRWANT